MKKLFAFSILMAALSADAATITLNGQTYTVSTFTGSYSSNPAYFTAGSMPWWGSAADADAAASSLGGQLGHPNWSNAFSPYFASGLLPYNGTTIVNNYYSSYYTNSTANGYYGLSDTAVYAYVAPIINSANTLQSIEQSAAGLATAVAIQSTALQSGLSHDCSIFDTKGLCVSAGGRSSQIGSGAGARQQAGLLVFAARLSEHFRVGGFADHSSTPAVQGVQRSGAGAMYGVFARWNADPSGLGLGASVAAASSDDGLTITRPASLANTEPGSGHTGLSGRALQAQVTYTLEASKRLTLSPYLGLRHHRIATDNYTEAAGTDVSLPMSYGAMQHTMLSALAGIGAQISLTDRLLGNASLGIQHHINHKSCSLQGTSALIGLEQFSVALPSQAQSVVTASAGLSYALRKNQQLSLRGLWQQQAFSSAPALSLVANLSVGF